MQVLCKDYEHAPGKPSTKGELEQTLHHGVCDCYGATSTPCTRDVIQSPVIPQHVAFAKVGKRQAAIDAVQDWLLFSFCEYYVLANSGFSKSAAAYSLVRKAIFTHPRFQRAPGRCDGTLPYSLEALGATWSGL